MPSGRVAGMAGRGDGTSVDVTVDDLGQHMATYTAQQQLRVALSQSAKADGVAPSDLFFDDYRPLGEIVTAMRGWVEQAKGAGGAHPDAHFNSSIGKTWEDRDIPMVSVGGTAPGSELIYIQGTMHAREWIAATTALWIARELLTSKDPKVVKLVQKYRWVIIPVANPDGYEFSRTPNNRLWRKNRNPNIDTDGNPAKGDCVGVDMNRNWVSRGTSATRTSKRSAGPMGGRAAMTSAPTCTGGPARSARRRLPRSSCSSNASSPKASSRWRRSTCTRTPRPSCTPTGSPSSSRPTLLA
eukprot:SAG22_NODE_336_length_12071_cov_10.875125_15_plen_298_part_00